jgi:hypothetical protein
MFLHTSIGLSFLRANISAVSGTPPIVLAILLQTLESLIQELILAHVNMYIIYHCYCTSLGFPRVSTIPYIRLGLYTFLICT